VLRLARDHARARFTIAQQVTELEASRRRVLAAQNAARVEVYEALCDGPLATFQEIANDLHSPAVPDAVIRASNRARMNLEELALDLNPVSARRPLATALRDVVDTCPVLVDLSMDPHLDLIDERGETIWFTVSEALANVVKHAPGATATVTVTLTDEALVVATISDDGPGEANAKGSGLQGLADRAEALGGSLRVSANLGGGTVVELRI
jgi:signal transduction histidine kinase